jgi:glycosyltransferase involved in cell wall biosynthesis
MKTILLLAYAISPTRGSEYSVGWNFLINLAKNNKVFVLTGLSGDHMGDTEEVEQYFKDNPSPNINLIAVKPTRFANLINWPNRVGILGPIFYLAFPFWQKEAYKIAKEIIKKEKIDIIHHLNPIGFREPGYLWKLNKPFIWGPIGGAQFVNLALLRYHPIKSKVFFLIKNFINFIQLNFNGRIRKAADKSSILVFSTEINRDNFEKFYNKIGPIISEQASFKINPILVNKKTDDSNLLDIVWIGQISFRKNLFLLFNAVSLIKARSGWRLNIIGDGVGRKQLEELADKLSISDNIIWHGSKVRSEAVSIIQGADLHAMTSLSEANTTVLYEAVSSGIPTISLDQDGMHSTLANGNGILVKVSTYDETIKLYASKIDELIENPKLLATIKQRTVTLTDEFSWEKKIQKFEEIYDEAIKNYHKLGD